MGQLLIGTSGYDYPEWKGVFYPDNVPRKDFLLYYSTVFNALELNNTFYNMPDAERMAGFYERSEGRLTFSVKANMLLTHKVSSLWQAAASEFIKSLVPLQEKGVLGAVLFQFPQSFHYTEENRFYLSDLIKAFEGLPVVVEFRHREWLRESVFNGLACRNAGVCFCDMPELKNLPGQLCKDGGKAKSFEKNNNGNVSAGDGFYLRLHGRNENAWYSSGENNGSQRYRYEYSEDELECFVPVIKTALEQKKVVQAYFNNHPKGYGAKNAVQLKNLCEGL